MVPRRKTRVTAPVCPLTTCMRVLGGAWTPNVIWYLRDAPRRFSELMSDLDGVSAKTLTARLRKLERDGVVHRTVKPTSPPTVDTASRRSAAAWCPPSKASSRSATSSSGCAG